MPKKNFQVQNVKCGGCANTLTSKLQDKFGDIQVNLEVMPREITLDIQDQDITELRQALKTLGYPMADENLGFMQNTTAQAKSFVSCAVGKFELAKDEKE
ncbi:heavy-metal-associated domain-containing protein [Sulfurimonas sp.]|uniref:heavy-metal-associated domain-containing protein n=1 Tax=Sulfurimonas sp. TaxID=2022749 RepID=UPI0026385709|nr:heavy-metal-associated domain-containing protein [Sulfurimonas sp.]